MIENCDWCGRTLADGEEEINEEGKRICDRCVWDGMRHYAEAAERNIS